MIILGIDPGLVSTGYGLIHIKNNNKIVLDYGTITPDKSATLSKRLNTIFKDVTVIINKFNPSIMVIEEVFYGKNVKSALLLGHARGASMISASNKDIPVFEYSARKVKQAITGNGTADKSQVQFMVMNELKIKKINSTDASDALGIALCHINQLKLQEL